MVVDFGKDLLLKFNGINYTINSKVKEKLFKIYPYFKNLINRYNNFCFTINNFNNEDIYKVLDSLISNEINFDNSNQELLFMTLTGRPSNFPNKFLTWKDESCFLDTLLIIMFESKSNFWRNKLFNTNIENLIHGKIISYNKELDIKENSKNLQLELYNLFLDLHGYEEREKYFCINIRSTLGKHVKNINKSSPVDVIYDAICDHFNDLKITISLFNDSKENPSSLILSEFNDNSDYLWNLYDEDILVFNNSNIKKKFLNNIDFKILDDKYELIGVIILKSNNPISEILEKGANGHYICYFKSYNDNWYYYNDLDQGKIKIIENIEDKRDELFTIHGRFLPVMFFYQKLI